MGVKCCHCRCTVIIAIYFCSYCTYHLGWSCTFLLYNDINITCLHFKLHSPCTQHRPWTVWSTSSYHGQPMLGRAQINRIHCTLFSCMCCEKINNRTVMITICLCSCILHIPPLDGVMMSLLLLYTYTTVVV